MALLADDSRAIAAREYFASFGDLASKIVQESEGVRSAHPKWNDLTYQQREQLVDGHFLDEGVKNFYADSSARNRSSSSLGAPSSNGGAAAGSGGETNTIGDVPTWEMLYPRPVPLSGQKFVHVGSGEDGEANAPAYVDEFAGNFQWETKSQLELWLPEGQALPSPRSVRRSLYKEDSTSHMVDLKRLSSRTADDSAVSNGVDGAGAPSVRAMARALQKTTTGKTVSSGRLGAPALAPVPSESPAPSPVPPTKASPGLSRTQSVATKPSPDTAPKPPRRSSSIVGDTPPPRIKLKNTGALSVPPPSASANFPSSASEEGPQFDADDGGGKPRPSPPVRRDSLSKKTGSTYKKGAGDEETESGRNYKPGAAQPQTLSISTPPSEKRSDAVQPKPVATSTPVPTRPTESTTNSSPKVEKPQRAPPGAPASTAEKPQRAPPAAPAGTAEKPQRAPPAAPASTAGKPQRAPPSAPAAAAKTPPAPTRSAPQPTSSTPEPVVTTTPSATGGSASAVETTFPATPTSPSNDVSDKLVGSSNSRDMATGTGFDFLSNW